MNKDDTITIGIGDPAGVVDGGDVTWKSNRGVPRTGRTRQIRFSRGRKTDGSSRCMRSTAGLSAARSEWYESSKVHWGLFYGCAAIFASALLYWPVIACSVGGWRAFLVRRAGFRGFLSTVAWLQSAASLGFVIGMTIVLGDPSEISFGLTTNLKLLLLLPQVCVVLGAITLLGCAGRLVPRLLASPRAAALHARGACRRGLHLVPAVLESAGIMKEPYPRRASRPLAPLCEDIDAGAIIAIISLFGEITN